jgi:hypothetical protein
MRRELGQRMPVVFDDRAFGRATELPDIPVKLEHVD